MSPKATGANRMEWFPLYHSDWTGDDKLTLCGLAAQGLLLRLMCKAWRYAGRISLDADEMNILACGDKDAAQQALAVLVKRQRIELSIETTDDTTMYHIFIPRLAEVYEEQKAKHERAVRNGVSGAKAKQRLAAPEEAVLLPDAPPVYQAPSEDIMPAVTHRTTPREAAILTKHAPENQGGDVVQSAADIAAVSNAIKALSGVGRSIGMSLGGGLRDRWAKVLMEVFAIAAKEANVSVDKISQSFILRLKDDDIRDKLRQMTWVRPEFLKTDWPLFVQPEITKVDEKRREEILRRIDKFYGGLRLLEKEHDDIDPDHKAKIIKTFWANMAHEFRLDESQLRELGYEPPSETT